MTITQLLIGITIQPPVCCMAHLIQVHLVGLLPGIQELPSSLLLQWNHHDVVTPETQQEVGSGLRKYTSKKMMHFFPILYFRPDI